MSLGSLDCGLPGVRKRFNALSWAGSALRGDRCQTRVLDRWRVARGSVAGPANPWQPATPHLRDARPVSTDADHLEPRDRTQSSRASRSTARRRRCRRSPTPMTEARRSHDGNSTQRAARRPTTDTRQLTYGSQQSAPSTRYRQAAASSLVPKNCGLRRLAGRALQAADAIGDSSRRCAEWRSRLTGDERVPGLRLGAFASSGEAGQRADLGGALLLLGGLYGGGLVKGVLTIRGTRDARAWRKGDLHDIGARLLSDASRGDHLHGCQRTARPRAGPRGACCRVLVVFEAGQGEHRVVVALAGVRRSTGTRSQRVRA